MSLFPNKQRSLSLHQSIHSDETTAGTDGRDTLQGIRAQKMRGGALTERGTYHGRNFKETPKEVSPMPNWNYAPFDEAELFATTGSELFVLEREAEILCREGLQLEQRAKQEVICRQYRLAANTLKEAQKVYRGVHVARAVQLSHPIRVVGQLAATHIGELLSNARHHMTCSRLQECVDQLDEVRLNLASLEEMIEGSQMGPQGDVQDPKVVRAVDEGIKQYGKLRVEASWAIADTKIKSVMPYAIRLHQEAKRRKDSQNVTGHLSNRREGKLPGSFAPVRKVILTARAILMALQSDTCLPHRKQTAAKLQAMADDPMLRPPSIETELMLAERAIHLARVEVQNASSTMKGEKAKGEKAKGEGHNDEAISESTGSSTGSSSSGSPLDLAMQYTVEAAEILSTIPSECVLQGDVEEDYADGSALEKLLLEVVELEQVIALGQIRMFYRQAQAAHLKDNIPAGLEACAQARAILNERLDHAHSNGQDEEHHELIETATHLDEVHGRLTVSLNLKESKRRLIDCEKCLKKAREALLNNQMSVAQQQLHRGENKLTNLMEQHPAVVDALGKRKVEDLNALIDDIKREVVAHSQEEAPSDAEDSEIADLDRLVRQINLNQLNTIKAQSNPPRKHKDTTEDATWEEEKGNEDYASPR